MKKPLIILSICLNLFTACKNDNSKVEELEKKIEQQSAEMQNMKESLLEKELEDKDAEIERLKASQSKQSNSLQSSGYFAKGAGRYPVASDRILTYNDLAYLPKSELTIMRNEIFARRGYIFKTQEMIQHFGRQNWYRPLYDDVYNQFTDIEKKNIQYIKSFE